ncbi:TspO/MBR family protein [Rhodohalobacter sp.]|uniref:TspO/MBR family protein n=1 Tax=Rhodohalobacter sp. TaxID=1974210 RepID=UPI002ACE5705|nr:TspO/MBR family protein [Rhodohalobacter sp.]MDZ7757208.1 TspO/MBR family protein [Rhodohalobacter sp.]
MNKKSTAPFKSAVILLLLLFLCFGVAWTGAQVSPGIASSEWYDQLNKPDWNPPGWLFGPVWTALYTMMAFAAWRVWRRLGFGDGKKELSLFGIQLFLNGLWSQLFFNAQNPGLAFIEIIMLLSAIIATTWLFYKQDRIAGWLMVPYILWVAFATVLNGTIWMMN